MSTFSEMSIPVLELTIKSYELHEVKCRILLIDKDSSFINDEYRIAIEKDLSLLFELIWAAKQELKKLKLKL